MSVVFCKIVAEYQLPIPKQVFLTQYQSRTLQMFDFYEDYKV